GSEVLVLYAHFLQSLFDGLFAVKTGMIAGDQDFFYAHDGCFSSRVSGAWDDNRSLSRHGIPRSRGLSNAESKLQGSKLLESKLQIESGLQFVRGPIILGAEGAIVVIEPIIVWRPQGNIISNN